MTELPHDSDIEASVLATLIIDQSHWEHASNLPDGAFLDPLHVIIWDAIKFQILNGKSSDIVSVSNYIKEKHPRHIESGFFRIGYVVEIVNNVPTISELQFHTHVDTLLNLYRRRALLALNEKLALLTKTETDASHIYLQSQREIHDLSTRMFPTHSGTRLQKAGEAAANALKTISEARENKGSLGLKTGYTALDLISTGMHPGDVWVLAARPGFGKTSYACNLSSNVAKSGAGGVVFFSLEMPKNQIMNRFVSAEAQLSTTLGRSGQMTDEQFDKYKRASQAIGLWPLWIDDRSAITVSEIRSGIDEAIRQAELSKSPTIKLVVLDYLQLIKSSLGRNSNAEQEIAYNSAAIKEIAKTYGVSVLLLSQLNRAIESSDRATPKLSDLRGSGAIEQDADFVGFLLPVDEPNGHAPQAVNLVILKDRNGEVGEIPLLFERAYTRFIEKV